jgi:hypothetical protein
VLPRPDRLDAIDRDLLARCADGDLRALETLFGRHGDAVWGCAEVASRRAGAPAEADLAVGAFVALWDHAAHVLAGSRPVVAVLAIAVARLGLGRTAFG